MVYRGHDEVLDREVAIKVLGSVAASVTGSRQEFLREARAAAALKHGGIVDVYDADVHGTERYIVMEYVPGGTLLDLIQAEAPLPAPHAVEIATQLALALDYGHRHGIVHCDVKPQNVLLDETGSPKLVDFGISRSIAATGALTDTISGTAGYIAPEQLLGEKLDGRADIYALGCVVYEMLTGELPFAASNLAALATQRLVRPPAPIRAKNPRIQIPLAEAVMRALERDPDQRYATASEFSEALAASMSSTVSSRRTRVAGSTAELTQRRSVETTVRHSTERKPLAEDRRRQLWPIAIVVLVALGLAGAVAAIEIPSLVHTPTGAAVAVPSLTGQQLPSAAIQLASMNLAVNLSLQDTSGTTTCTGQVLGQSPGPATRLGSGSAVTLFVSQNSQC